MNTRQGSWALCILIILAALPLTLTVRGQSVLARNPYTTWSDYGGSADSMQYSALRQINKSNVAQLQQAWFYPVTDRNGAFSFNPIVVDGVMYVLGRKNSITALDAATALKYETVVTFLVEKGARPGANKK